MNGQFLSRGYKYNQTEQEWIFNTQTVSGDMLCGLNLAVLNTNDDFILEKYDELVHGIIHNDYALLEGEVPDTDEITHDIYKNLLSKYKERSLFKLKSNRGMWQPGIETVGAQALTILATLKLAEKKTGNSEAAKHYKKLFYGNGFGLLSIFPTAYIDSRRGYFNDHNCLIALYVLSKLTTNPIEKFIYKMSMKYVWSLSKHWYNPYFTGLVKEVYPDLISKEYVDNCIAYLHENEPRDYGFLYSKITIDSNVPVTYNLLDEDEFSPDLPQNRRTIVADEKVKIKTGLGFLASAIMIEEKPEVLLEGLNNITSIDKERYS